MVGTPAYMAPEQAWGAGPVTPAADQWSAAAMLYEMLSGHLPNESSSLAELVARPVAQDAAAVAPHRVEVDAALVRLPTRIGTLRVLGELSGLAVLVDGDARPLDAARAGLPVSAGVRRVTLRAPGHPPRELEVRVAGGECVGVEAALEPERSTLAVSCATPDATVRVDGEPVGTAPLPSPVEVATGRHRVEITRDGYAPFVGEVDARDRGRRGGAVVRALLLLRRGPLPARRVQRRLGRPRRRARGARRGVGVAIVGAASLVTGVVLWTRAGSAHRFDPPGTIRS